MPAETWTSVPWRDADHRNHPNVRHRCRCTCDAVTKRMCPEHGEIALAAVHHTEETPK